MDVSKEALAKYLRAAALEEEMVSMAADLEIIEGKLRSWDRTTFEAILKQRGASLRALASGHKEGIFSAECYAAQAETIESITKSLEVILEEHK